MKKSIIMVAAFLASFIFVSAQKETAAARDTTGRINLYTCPMHPGVSTDKPGKCPYCGMDLNLSQKDLLKTQVTSAYTCPVHANEIADKPGKCPRCGTQMILSLKEKMKAEVAKAYTCPMHPDVASKEPGKCPKCGMSLTEKKQ